MRKVWVWVLGVGLVLGTSVCAMPLSLCDYQSPETNLTDMRLSFSYRYLDNPTAEGAEVNAGRIGVDFDQISDSADMGFSLSGSVEVSMVDFTPSDALGQAAGTFRYYITDEMPIFAFGGLEGSMTTGRLQPGVQVRAGMGYGRFSDVTPLAKAFAIQDALLDLGAIGDALPDDVLMGLAEAIGRIIEYEELKDLVADIEAQIEGTALVELDARALLSIEEEILVVGDDRSCGWAVQGGFGYELLDPNDEDRDLLIVASADVACAPVPEGQFRLHASVSGPFDILEDNALTARASYEHILSETSSLNLVYVLDRVDPSDPEAEPTAGHSASMALLIDLGGADITVQVSLTRDAEATGWTTDISLSAGMDLL